MDVCATVSLSGTSVAMFCFKYRLDSYTFFYIMWYRSGAKHDSCSGLEMGASLVTNAGSSAAPPPPWAASQAPPQPPSSQQYPPSSRPPMPPPQHSQPQQPGSQYPPQQFPPQMYGSFPPGMPRPPGFGGQSRPMPPGKLLAGLLTQLIPSLAHSPSHPLPPSLPFLLPSSRPPLPHLLTHPLTLSLTHSFNAEYLMAFWQSPVAASRAGLTICLLWCNIMWCCLMTTQQLLLWALPFSFKLTSQAI